MAVTWGEQDIAYMLHPDEAGKPMEEGAKEKRIYI